MATQAQRLAGLRVRARNELATLRKQQAELSDVARTGLTGSSIQQQIDAIEKATAGTYLGRNATKETRYDAEKSANMLRTLIGRRGGENRAATRERQNRIFYQQQRVAAKGGASALYGTSEGETNISSFYEQVFYIATQDIWSGKAITPEGRNDLIMRTLGVTSLQDAYDIVMEGNVRVLGEIRRLVEEGELELGDLKEKGGSDRILALIRDSLDILAERG